MRAIAVILGAIIVAVGLAGGAVAAERIGQVKVVSGDVSLMRAGQAIAVETGTELFEGDEIVTGEGSAVGMTFSDNSRMSLGPDSSLILESYAFQSGGRQDGFNARLKAGSLSASSGQIAKSRPLAMKVLMPTTVLGVKGTTFVVRVSGES